jgi:hypothetical protein
MISESFPVNLPEFRSQLRQETLVLALFEVLYLVVVSQVVA